MSTPQHNADIFAKIIVITLIICTGIVSIRWQQNLSRHYQADFSAYWSAGKAINEGVYRYSYKPVDEEGMTQKHAMFLNPPIIAHPFRLFGALPYKEAKAAWYWTQLTLFVLSVCLLARNNWERLFISAGTVIGMPLLFWPLYAELERGETNMLTLFAISIAYYLWKKKKHTLSGMILGLGSAFKFPLLLLFAVPLAIRQYKAILAGAIAFLSVFGMSLLVDGIEINYTYFTEYLPVIARKDHLPSHVFAKSDTASPPLTRWQGETYITRRQFHASSGSATRFFRSWFQYKVDRSLIIGGAAITGGIILLTSRRRSSHTESEEGKRLFEDIAWSATIMGTLILHTLAWITNYVVFIAPLVIMWRHALRLWQEKRWRPIIAGLYIGTIAITIGDPITHLVPKTLPTAIDIILRNRTWMGGMLIWGILLLLLILPTNSQKKRLSDMSRSEKNSYANTQE